MGKVIISTNTDIKKVQEVALGIEEVYRAGIQYKISEFILAFGGGINQTPGKDSGFIIPGPYINIEIFENAFSLPSLPLTMVYVWYKDEDVKMDNTQDAEKKIEELRCLIDDLVECNKKLEDEKHMLLQERRQLTAKIMKLDEKAAKEKENKEFEKAYVKNLEDVNDRLRKTIERLEEESEKEKEKIFQTSKNIIDNKDGAFFEEAYNSGFISNMWKTIESKEKSIQALMDQLDARDREIEKYKFMVIHMADDLYGKGDLDRGEEDLEDEENGED